MLYVQLCFSRTRSNFLTRLLCDEILTGDIGILQNADMAGGEFQIGDIGKHTHGMIIDSWI